MWRRPVDPQLALGGVFGLGLFLAMQPAGQEETEAAYREAIAAGDEHAANNFGLLLAEQRGREREAEAAYRAAIAAGDTDAWNSLAHRESRGDVVLQLVRHRDAVLRIAGGGSDSHLPIIVAFPPQGKP